MRDNWQAFLQKLKTPTGKFLALWYALTILCVGGALALVVIAPSGVWAIVSYVLYALAAVTFGYTVYTLVLFAPRVKRGVMRYIKRTRFGRRLLEHYGFRTVVFAAVSFVFNVLYALFNGLVAIASRSIWYGALATYYIVLTFMRGGIISYHGKSATERSPKVELRKYRSCGILLTTLPLCLSFAILQMVVDGSAFVRWGWTVFAFAAYAFYKITMAIYNVFKARKMDDMTLRALRSIGLADAMVSILALQTTLLYAFSTGNNGAANALTGGVVCALTVVIGVYMLICARKKKEELQKENEYAKSTGQI
ncbi:MAG: hypothetical protein E7357_05685 [Clostridiales bacterium]|nr:hypothetical protein [Clostridiales bacterium]